MARSSWFVILLATVIYGAGLFRIADYDESFTYLHYTDSPASVLTYSLPNNHILYSAAVYLTRQIVPIPKLALRLPAYVFMLLALILCARLAARSGQTTCMPTLLLALAWPAMNYATQGRGYSLSMLLALVLFALVQFPGLALRWKLAVTLTGAALVLTLPTLILFILPVMAYERRAVPYLALGALAGTALYLPSLPYITGFGHFAEGNVLANLWAVYGLNYVVVIVIAVSLMFYRHERTLDLSFLLVVLVPVFLPIIIEFILTGHTLPVRTFVYMVPILCLYAGDSWDWTQARLGSSRGVAYGMVTGSVLIGLVLYAQRGNTGAALDTIVRNGPTRFAACCVLEPVMLELPGYAEPANDATVGIAGR